MIFDRAIRRMANETPAEELTLTDAGGWRTGKSMVPTNAGSLKLSAVNRAIECRADSMSKLPIFIMDKKTKEHIDHPLLYLLTVRPNEAMTPSVYKGLVESNRLMGGNGYAAIMRSRSSARPVELLPLPWECVQPFFDDRRALWYGYTDPVTGNRYKLNQWDMLHYKAFSLDGITGISVLTRARMVISTGLQAQEYENYFYSRNAQPPGILTVDSELNKAAKDKIREEWAKVHAGVDNAFRIAVLDLGMKYQSIGIPNKDAQFVESKAITVEDIARFFNVPMYKLMAGKQSYNSNEQNSIEYVVSAVHPSVTQYEEEDTYKLLFDSELHKGLEIRRNMMAELRGDTKSRAEWYKTGREIGYFSVDDICDLEDTPHVPGGDTRQASLNYVPLDLFRELSVKRNNGPKNSGGEGN